MSEEEKKMVKETIDKHIAYGRRPRIIKKKLFDID